MNNTDVIINNSTNESAGSPWMLLSTESPSDQVPTNQITPDPVSQATVKLVADILVCHVIPITSAFGIVGNILTILVLSTQKRGQPLDFLLVILAVVDACFLVFENLGFIACNIRQDNVIAARNFEIMTLPHVLWVGVTLSRISSMLTVVIAVERCFVVMLPLKVKVWVTSTTIHVTTALACVIPALAHIPVFMRGEIQWLTHSRLNASLPYLTLTDFALSNAEFLNVYKNLVLNVLFRYVPMATVSFCTGLTIAQLKQYSQWRLHSANNQRDRASLSDKDARISVTLLRVCAVFIVCSLPGCVMLTIRLLEPQFDFYGTYYNSFLLAKEVNELFLAVNSSVNFVIYMRSGDDFRKAFCRICQRTLPGCCFNFLFRCVLRTDQDFDATSNLGKKSSSLAKSVGNTGVSRDTYLSTLSAAVSKAEESRSEQDEGMNKKKKEGRE